MELSAGKVDSEYVTDLQTKLSQTRRELKEKIEENKQQQEKLVPDYKCVIWQENLSSELSSQWRYQFALA